MEAVLNKIIIKDKVTGEPISPVTNVKAIEGLENTPIKEEVIDTTNLPDLDVVTREELKLDLFIDLWNALGVYGTKQFTSYNPSEAPDKEHEFNCNNVWLTYKEAIAVAEKGVIRFPNVNRIGLECRTILCTTEIGGTFQLTYGAVSLKDMASGSSVETIRLHPRTDIQLGVDNLINAFSGCRKLKEIIGKFSMAQSFSASNARSAFSNCELLENLELGNLKISISFAQSPLLALSSLQYMVKNAANTAPITITVHPQVYAKLIGIDCFNIDTNYINKGNTESQIKEFIATNHIESWTLNATGIVRPFTQEDVGKYVYMNLEASNNAKPYYLIAQITSVNGSTIETKSIYGVGGKFDENYSKEDWNQILIDAQNKNITFTT